jgi:serine-type D-Ala-D-Ala carboxypeptidase/endopeptidase (penicillin-binding protein 4)
MNRSHQLSCCVLACFTLAMTGCSPLSARSGIRPLHRALSPRTIASLDSLVVAGGRTAHVGVAVCAVSDSTRWLYLHDGDRLFTPASNAKLLTAVAALDLLGANRRFSTDLRMRGILRDSVLHGNLFLVAGGAPDLSTGDIARLAARVRSLGVTNISGNLVLDASLFDSVAFGPGWMWDEGPYAFNAPINAFMLNGNTLEVAVRPGRSSGDTVSVSVSPPTGACPVSISAVTCTTTTECPRLQIRRDNTTLTVTGTMRPRAKPVIRWRTVPDPVEYAGRTLHSELLKAGIGIEGTLQRGTCPDSGVRTIARMRSATVDVLVRNFLKSSTNIIGETLVKQCGVQSDGQGTWESGLCAIRRSLAERRGLDSTEYRLADGSGLSRYTLVSPRQIARLLAVTAGDFRTGPELMSALPIAGTDGTLRWRMRGMRGEVRAKTGTMSGVSSLSGYLRTEKGDILAFSVLVNGFLGPAREFREMQDELIGVLRRDMATVHVP